MDGAFTIAFAAGQAAIAWFVSACLLTASTGSLPRPGTAALLLALGVLAVAVLAALSPIKPSDTVLRMRRWGTGVLALACVISGWPAVPAMGSPTPLAPSGLSPDAAQWLALAALFFAGVGWESVTNVVPAGVTNLRRITIGVALGVTCVAVVYLGLASLLRLSAGAAVVPEQLSAPLNWGLAGVTAIVLTSYCWTNLRTAARIAQRLYGSGRRSAERGPAKAVVAVVGAACCAFVWVGARDGAVPLLLLGPAAAALIGYGLAALAAVRCGGPFLRCFAAVILSVLVFLAAPAVPFLFGV
ncbi:hypothetical protein [Actinopolyspora xinjiangensis]|uniref:hypothetical protein n=1 Tax=Actinopolyspora xinjiangensis TaxID=405564 RepID=UPI001B8D1DE1|nr:hypothetical protein [Actinopolyspora xinjiangensis]